MISKQKCEVRSDFGRRVGVTGEFRSLWVRREGNSEDKILDFIEK